MIHRDMIEQIVREVVAQLSKEEKAGTEAKPKLLVVGDTSFLEPKHLLLLQTRWIVVHYEGEKKVYVDLYDRVLFLHATQDLITKGALGIFDNTESKLLSRCFMESTPVSIIPTVYLQDHLFSSSPKNKAYVAQIQRYHQALLEFGAKVETLESFLETLTVKPKQEPLSRSAKKKILTRRDVQDCKESVLKVDSNTIITPLAKDTAREMGIDIVELDLKGEKREWN
ncbi:hypothetical protein [Alkalihalobacillus sp. BA299]|uniref:hypothetical protein n=1 Tax=Alkalihalobacillus sp. BA299 TaxID=2815938 RepID=UPI001ADAF6B0|nr:hypothetical protein [Alkalihalobacillus sp. BA299]